jgi:3-dehydroquinate synthase
LLRRLPAILEQHAPAHRYAIITDSNVDHLYARDLAAALGAVPHCTVFTFEAGEASKSRRTWGIITDQMLDAGLGRDSVVLAVGGGVAGDLGGFIASTYLRGVPFVQVPTSLLAMIDSSVGGKTGVDTSRGKNLVGTFYQPTVVIIDASTLKTLTDRHVRAGAAEAVKHAAIADSDYFNWIESNSEAILDRDIDVLLELVIKSVNIKSRVVSDDETEQGKRAILNFGHTVGHALETSSRYDLLHGEAVAIGMIAEAELGVSLGITEESTPATLRSAVAALQLPVKRPSNLSPQVLHETIEFDKKARYGEPRFTLLEQIGRVSQAPDGHWTHRAPEAAIFEAFSHIM